MWNYSSTPQPLSKVFADSFGLYKASFSQVWYWHLIWFFPMSILAIASQFAGKNFPLYVLWIATAIIAIFYLFGEAFLLHRIHKIALQGQSDAQSSLSVALRKLPSILLLYFCSLLFISVTVFMVVFSVESMTNVATAGRFVLALEFPIIIGCTLLVAYYFWFITFIVMIKMINDDKRLPVAFKEAFSLVEGKWWRSFFAIILGSAFLFIAARIFSGVAGIFTSSEIVSSLAVLIAYVLFHSVFNSILLVQYHDLKLRHDKKAVAANEEVVLR